MISEHAHALCFGFFELSINMVIHQKFILDQTEFILKTGGASQLPP